MRPMDTFSAASPAAAVDLLDALDDRLAPYAHTFMGYYANHAPMATEAMIALGRTERAEQYVQRWIHELDLIDPNSAYAERLERVRAAVDADWRVAVADVAREASADGFAHLGHGVIRTGHAVRALQAHDSVARRGELARALTAWAEWAESDALPDGSTARSADELVTELVQRAMAGYAESPPGRPSFFALHTVTTAVAIDRVRSVLPDRLAAASVSAFLAAMHEHIGVTPVAGDPADMPYDLAPLIDRAVASGDAHDIKLVDALVFPPTGLTPTDPNRDAAIERFAADLGVVLERRPGAESE